LESEDECREIDNIAVKKSMREDIKMNRKIYIIVLLLFAAVTLGGISYAGSGSGGMGVGSGSGDHGMMGGQNHGMMDQNYSNSWREQSRTNQNYRYGKKETQSLREEIKAKRQELSALYRSEKPNKKMIDQKITELDELEAKLDEKLSKNN
jgi:Spy/CpxP family protein refolding chaperone